MATAVDVVRSAPSGATLRAGAHSLVPSWVSAQALNTWGVMPTSNVLADLDPDLDPAINPDYPTMSGGIPVAPWRPAGVSAGQFVNITDWSGAAFNLADHEMWIMDAGGHNSMWDAQAIKLRVNLETPGFYRVSTPTGAIGKPAFDYVAEMARGDFALDSTGNPRTHHTLNCPFYWPGKGPMSISEIVICSSGGTEPGHDHPYWRDPTTGALLLRGANNNNNAAKGFCAACYDDDLDVAWKLPGSSAVPFSYWGGPDDDTWTTVGSAPEGTGLQHSSSLCNYPGTGLLLVGTGGGFDPRNSSQQTIVGGFAVFDKTTGVLHKPTFVGAPTTAPQQFPNGLWPGTCQPRWSARLGAFLAWDNITSTTQIMRITPPASGDPRTASWTIDYLPVSGANVVTPSAALVAGTYGRFGIFDDLGIAVLQNGATEAPYFFRYI